MYIQVYVLVYVCMCPRKNFGMCCMYACMFVCNVRMYEVCMFVGGWLCICACMYIHMHMHVYTCIAQRGGSRKKGGRWWSSPLCDKLAEGYDGVGGGRYIFPELFLVCMYACNVCMHVYL